MDIGMIQSIIERLEEDLTLLRTALNGHIKPTVIHTYIVKASGGLIKIGKSALLGRRIKTLQMASPERLVLVGSVPVDIEKELHRAYREKRIHGEWFDIDPNIIMQSSLWLNNISDNVSLYPYNSVIKLLWDALSTDEWSMSQILTNDGNVISDPTLRIEIRDRLKDIGGGKLHRGGMTKIGSLFTQLAKAPVKVTGGFIHIKFRILKGQRIYRMTYSPASSSSPDV